MKVLILGGTRFVGRTVCRILLDAGAEVTILHRGVTAEPVPGTRSMLGDRAQADGLSVLDGERFDAVLDMSAYFAEWTAAAVASLRGRVRHYVFISSGAVYRPSPELPWRESTPFGPNPIWGRYGEEKVASERMLWAEHADGSFAVTSFRFPFILGPANFADRESFVFSRLEARRPVLLPGAGTSLNQFVFAEDVAKALVVALERPDVTGGEAYNCAYERGITNHGWVQLCADIAGIDAEIVPIDEAELGVQSATVDLTDIVFPYPSEHYLLDGTKLARDLGVAMTNGNRRMLEEYFAWWETHPDHTPRRYAREDRALAALGLT